MEVGQKFDFIEAWFFFHSTSFRLFYRFQQRHRPVERTQHSFNKFVEWNVWPKAKRFKCGLRWSNVRYSKSKINPIPCGVTVLNSIAFHRNKFERISISNFTAGNKWVSAILYKFLPAISSAEFKLFSRREGPNSPSEFIKLWADS